LISRRTPPNEPLAPATLPPPMADLNESRVGVMAAALAPALSKMTLTGVAEAQVQATSAAAAANQKGVRMVFSWGAPCQRQAVVVNAHAVRSSESKA
jgi:hypothetical protein